MFLHLSKFGFGLVSVSDFWTLGLVLQPPQNVPLFTRVKGDAVWTYNLN